MVHQKASRPEISTWCGKKRVFREEQAFGSCRRRTDWIVQIPETGGQVWWMMSWQAEEEEASLSRARYKLSRWSRAAVLLQGAQ